MGPVNRPVRATAVPFVWAFPGILVIALACSAPAQTNPPPDIQALIVKLATPETQWLTIGVRCIVADYDGNGANDYALSGAEGSATVILSKPDGGFLKAVRLDAGGLLSLYRPRAIPGPGLERANAGETPAAWASPADRAARPA